jgi:site-specific DNA-methyltransferase (adenine-specific)/modification methylase
MKVETIGRATLYLGDCREVLPTLGKVDAVVTDPPYGIAYKSHLDNLGAQKFDEIANDRGELDLRPILCLAERVLSFGANCYPHQLPHRGRWFCWDKRTIDGSADKMMGSPFELAWSNKTSGFDKIARVLHGGVVNADGQGRRGHPTQKPIAVMRQAIEWAAPDARTILDPFMGSGSTGVAAVQMGRDFIGIEVEPAFFDIACRRIEEAQKQGDLFIEQTANGKTKKKTASNDLFSNGVKLSVGKDG